MLGYAVIDCETTGLNRRGNDRIAEIAVATYDLDFKLTGRYETLLNPERDLGLTSLHGINGLMASIAPRFEDIMASLGNLLHDRIIIGHNVEFDLRFFATEFEKHHIDIWWQNSYIDTLVLARSLRLNTENYKLGTLCSYLGIPLSDAHEAMADVMATAELFQSLIEIKYDEISKLAEPFNFPTHQLALSSDFSVWTPRAVVHERIGTPYDLNMFLSTLPLHNDELHPETVQNYLSTIHTCLINDSFTFKEREKMEETIADFSLSFNQVIDLNEEYLFLLICRNLTNNVGRWSDADTASMKMAMEFTGIRESRVEELTNETLANRHVITTGLQTLKRLFSLQEGDAFVLSGEEFSRGKRYWEYKLMDSGYIVKPNTTKQGIKAVICNDPYSLSNKAVAARNYGIPILTENTITNMIKQHR